VPDIIVNPHALPSRMTVGQLLECVCAKAACVRGTAVDATAFEPVELAPLQAALEGAGF
jgi:DNA-directed RNA polymerase beta subunit